MCKVSHTKYPAPTFQSGCNLEMQPLDGTIVQ